MVISFFHVLSLLILSLAGDMCWAGSSYQVTFPTVECNGEAGIATVEIGDIFRIQSFECEHPDAKIGLMQVVVRSSSLSGSYDVLTVERETAEEIMREIRDYMGARKRLVEKGEAVLLHYPARPD